METTGIPTLCLGSALDIIQSVNPPRAAFLDYPLGHTTGKLNDSRIQHDILAEALNVFNDAAKPGDIKMLPFKWEEDDAWKETAVKRGDDRQVRDQTPQYQYEEDRILAENN